MIHTQATIREVQEKTEIERDGNHTLVFFYPVISYEYQFAGRTFSGGCGVGDKRRYRVSESYSSGGKRPDAAYFWRGLKVGQPFPVIVDESNPQQSRLAYGENQDHGSQKLAVLLGILIVVAALALAICFR